MKIPRKKQKSNYSYNIGIKDGRIVIVNYLQNMDPYFIIQQPPQADFLKI